MKSIFEEMGGTYSNINGYLLPNLAMPESPPLGKYGRMQRRYLKEHRPVLYTNLLMTGKLNQHLAEIDEACERRMELLISQMAMQEGVTEALKGRRSDGVGAPHDQHPQPGRRDRAARTRLQLMKV